MVTREEGFLVRSSDLTKRHLWNMVRCFLSTSSRNVGNIFFCILLVPSGRWGHDMCLIDKRKAVLIGGQGSKLQMAKDSVWTLNMSQG